MKFDRVKNPFEFLAQFWSIYDSLLGNFLYGFGSVKLSQNLQLNGRNLRMVFVQTSILIARKKQQTECENKTKFGVNVTKIH